MSGLRDAATAGLNVLQVVAGAGLLSVIVYRFYLNRPQRDVPVTDEELAAYKRTGRHRGRSGFSGYPIRYGGRRGGLVLLLTLGAAAGLAGSLLSRQGGHRLGGTQAHWALAGICSALVGVYCAGLAGLVLHEVRTARRLRVAQVLDALALPTGARVLCVESLLGVLAIAAATHDGIAQVEVLVADAPAALEQTHINLRRASVPDRARAVGAVDPDRRFDAVLVALPAAAGPWLRQDGPAGVIGWGTGLPPGWQALPLRWPGRLLGLLSAGRLTPFSGIRVGNAALP